MEDYLSKQSEEVKTFFAEARDLIRQLREQRQKNRIPLNGEYYVTNDQLSRFLHLSKRTLQSYRDKRILSYIALEGKILYRESDVEKLLQQNYVKAFE